MLTIDPLMHVAGTTTNRQVKAKWREKAKENSQEETKETVIASGVTVAPKSPPVKIPITARSFRDHGIPAGSCEIVVHSMGSGGPFRLVAILTEVRADDLDTLDQLLAPERTVQGRTRGTDSPKGEIDLEPFPVEVR